MTHIELPSQDVQTHTGRSGVLPDPLLSFWNVWLYKASLVIVSLLLILVAWWLTLSQLAETRQSLIQGVITQQRNLVTIFGDNFSQALGQHQALSLLIHRALNSGSPETLTTIPGFLSGKKVFNRLAVFDQNGNTLYQTSPPAAGYPQGDELTSYIQRVAKMTEPVAIDQMWINPATPWQIPLLVPINTLSRGRVIMLLEADLGYILNLYQDIDLGRTGRIMVQSEKGDLLATAESGGLSFANTFRARQFPKELFGEKGTMLFPTPSSREGEQVTYRHLDGYPLTVSVGQDMDEVLSEYNRSRSRQIWILGVITSVCAFALGWLFNVAQKKEQYLKALQAADNINTDLIRKLEKEHQKAVDAASLDPLTNLYNRRLFVALAEKNLLLTKRNRIQFAFLFIDLDRFKTINDTLGHQVGDLLLKRVAERLVGCVRETDVIGRLGGDEFVVMLTGTSPQWDVAKVAEKIVGSLSAPYTDLDGHEVMTSPSIGIALHPRDGEDIDTLLRNADAAMYESKRAGRGRYTFFDPSLNHVSFESFELEQRVPLALEKGEFVLHFQPKIRLDDFRCVGLEALVRWDHPEQQLIFPGAFIPLMEKSGQIIDLGQWILNATCRQMSEWKAMGVELVPIAINVSPRQLKDRIFTQMVFETLNDYGLAPKDLELEITESTVMESQQTVKETLESLRDGGIRVSLDDFGNGFSCLDHIRSLPIQTLKIDRSFVENLRNNTNDAVIVGSTIELAKRLNLIVVAEGVETSEQLLHLKMAGCHQVQGYLFSRPLPADQILTVLRNPIRTPDS